MAIQWLPDNKLEGAIRLTDLDDEVVLNSVPNHGTEYLNDYNTATLWSAKSKSDVEIVADLGSSVSIDTCVVLGTLKNADSLTIGYSSDGTNFTEEQISKPVYGTGFGTLVGAQSYQFWKLSINTPNLPAIRRGRTKADFGRPSENRFGLNPNDDLWWSIGDKICDYIHERLNRLQGAIRFLFVPRWSGTSLGTKTLLSICTDFPQSYLSICKLGDEIEARIQGAGGDYYSTKIPGTSIIPYGTYHLVFTWCYRHEVIPSYYMALYLNGCLGTYNEGSTSIARIGHLVDASLYFRLGRGDRAGDGTLVYDGDVAIESLAVEDEWWGSSRVEKDYLEGTRTLMRPQLRFLAPFIAPDSEIAGRLEKDPDYGYGWVESDAFYWRSSQEETDFVPRTNSKLETTWEYDQQPEQIGTATKDFTTNTIKNYYAIIGSLLVPTSQGTLDAGLSFVKSINSGYHFGHVWVYTSDNPYTMKYTFNIFETDGSASLFGTDLLKGTWNRIEYQIFVDSQQNLKWRFGLWGTVDYSGTGTYAIIASEIALYKAVTDTGTGHWYSSAGTFVDRLTLGTVKRWYFYKAGTCETWYGAPSGTKPVTHWCMEVGTVGPIVFNWKTKSEKHQIYEWFLGKKTELSENPEANYRLIDRFDVEKQKTKGGKSFTYFRYSYRSWQFTYSTISEADKETLRQIVRKAKGPYKPIYMILFPDNPEPIRVTLESEHEWQDMIGGWNYTLILSEEK